jgi:hypothetical protein
MSFINSGPRRPFGDEMRFARARSKLFLGSRCWMRFAA